MGVFTGFQPRKNLFKNRETSGLASYRERDSVLRGWKSDREESFRSDKSNQMLLQTRQELARATQRSGNHYGMHPFKIYNFPTSLRQFPVSDDWQRFKVRDSLVTVAASSGFAASIPVWGSDQLGDSGATFFDDDYGLFQSTQVPPSNNAQTTSDGLFSTWNEIVIPANSIEYIFWFSLILPVQGGSWGGISTNHRSTGIAVCKSTDQTKAQLMLTLETFDCTTMWPTFPLDDPYNFYIGSVRVDNGTLALSKPGYPQVQIYQSRNTNLAFPADPMGTNGLSSGTCPFRWRGTYNGAASYFIGDVVTITYADASTVNSFYQYIYDPTLASSFHPRNIPGPLIGASPNGHSPDPWRLLSKSPSDADYHVDASYQAAKAYLHT